MPGFKPGFNDLGTGFKKEVKDQIAIHFSKNTKGLWQGGDDMKVFDIDQSVEHLISPFEGIGSTALGTESVFTGLVDKKGIATGSTSKYGNAQFI